MIKKIEVQKFLVTECEENDKVIQQVFTLSEPPVLIATIEAKKPNETSENTTESA